MSRRTIVVALFAAALAAGLSGTAGPARSADYTIQQPVYVGLPLVSLPPQYALSLPDLKITDIRVCWDFFLGGLYVDVDVKNRGSRAYSGPVRIDVALGLPSGAGGSLHASHTVNLTLGVGQTVSHIAVAYFATKPWTVIQVDATVDAHATSTTNSFYNSFGAIWEMDETNNTRTAWFEWDGSTCGYHEF
jgi:hypothetical protein